MSSTKLAVLAALGVFLAAVGLTLAAYRFHLTPGLLILCAGWAALFTTAVLLVRAARAFDLGHDQDLPGLASVDAGRRQDLEREKRLLYKAIKEAEFDRDMGKLEVVDADEVIGRYRARAVEILRALDVERDHKYELAIEAELAQRLAKPAAPGDAVIQVDKVTFDTSIGKVAIGRLVITPGGQCITCSTQNDADAVFCKTCGGKLVRA